MVAKRYFVPGTALEVLRLVVLFGQDRTLNFTSRSCQLVTIELVRALKDKQGG